MPVHCEKPVAMDTPLHKAARDGDLQTLQYLVEKKSLSVNEKNNYGWTPLHRAAWEGHLDVVKYLIDKGASVNEKTNNGSTPLHLAAQQGHLDVVKYLIDKGVSVNEKDKNGDTPLHVAVKKGHTKIIELLLNNGANPDYTNNKGERALELATNEKTVDAAQTTNTERSHSTEASDMDSHQKLTESSRIEYTPFVLSETESEDSDNTTNAFEVNFLDDLGAFGYHNAAKSFKGNVGDFHEIAEMLERYGEDINAKARIQLSDGTLESWTVLEYAVHMGYVDLVKELLDRKDVHTTLKPWTLLIDAKKQQRLWEPSS